MRLAGVVVVMASCWSASPAPTTPVTLTAQVPADPGFAKPLAGPFVDLGAYCGTLRQDVEACRIVDNNFAERQVPFTDRFEILYVTAQAPVSRCVVAFRTAFGWFVSPPSKDACRDPSYIELREVRVDIEGDVVAVHIDLDWQTKGPRGAGDASADYTLTTFCGMANTPVCTRWFTSKCERGAPASDCLMRGYEATWKIDGKTLTLETTPRSADPNVPHGTHRLF
jgi:hypothetical protein